MGFSDAREYGWKLASEGHDWGKMVEQIQNHIGSLNFGYRTTLREKNVTYVNAYGRFKDKNTIIATKKNGQEQVITTDKVVIAGRTTVVSRRAGGEGMLHHERRYFFQTRGAGEDAVRGRVVHLARNRWVLDRAWV